MKITKLFITVLILFLVFGACTNSNQNSKKNIASEKQTPNIIYILADDMGYGDRAGRRRTNDLTHTSA